MQIRPIKPVDLRALSKIHLEAFKDHLNVHLGFGYVKAFIGWFATNPQAISLVAVENDNPLGYVVGAPWGYQKQMNKDLLGIAVKGIISNPQIFFKSRVINTVWLRLMTLFGLNKSLGKTQNMYQGRIISLVGIGVSKEARGKGVAPEIMKDFLELARQSNFDFARLSVYASNLRARRFYEKNQWQLEQPSDGKVVGYYYKLKN